MRVIWNGMAATQLSNDQGGAVVIADHGAHVVSWKPTGEKDVFFLSGRSAYKAHSAIRGGVPVIFPQFGAMGSGQRHGFARLHDWKLQEEGVAPNTAHATYRLTNRDLPENTWAHSFELDYTITLHPTMLTLALTVRNVSDDAWDFQAALHTYLRVSDAALFSLNGLNGRSLIDQADGGIKKIQQTETLDFCSTEVDRIYLDAPEVLHIDDGEHRVRVEQQGFRDTVVWNPGPTKAAMLADLTPGGWQEFVCIEAAQVVSPPVLRSGEHWTGKQILSLLS